MVATPFVGASAAAAEPVAKPAPTDHQAVAGHAGFGFLGMSDLPLPVAAPSGTKDRPALSPNDRLSLRVVSAPVLGVRYWWNQCVGLDAGLGLYYSAGSTTAELGDETSDLDKQTIFAMLLHAGVPLRLADTRHMVVLLIPEVTFGTARSDVSAVFDDNAPPDAELRGYRLDVGARAGAEIHFGFMGLPSLALEAGIGFYVSSQWASATVANQSLSDISTSISTTSLNAPWDFFRVGSVAARYYF